MKRAPEHIPAWLGGAPPPLPFGYPTFGTAPVPFMPMPTVVRGLEDMLSSPLGQYISSYEPPHDFNIPSFAMYDGSSDPYDHMMHFNQVMILSVENDRLLCKVFPTSLKRLALAWFHKCVRRVVDCLRLLVLMLSPTKGKHQLTANHLLAGG